MGPTLRISVPETRIYALLFQLRLKSCQWFPLEGTGDRGRERGRESKRPFEVAPQRNYSFGEMKHFPREKEQEQKEEEERVQTAVQ